MLGRYDEAINSFDKAIQIDPTDYSYWNDREKAKELLNKTAANHST